MSKLYPAPSNRVRRDSLFIHSRCSDCPLFEECGGSSTTPCGCLREEDPCYDCKDSNVLCRARGDGAFLDSLENGRSLGEVSLEQQPTSFPLFIPKRTRELGDDVHLNLRWAGISLKNLLREKESLPGEVHPNLTSDHDLRRHLHVGKHCQLLAILNGQDYQLEGLWDMERRKLYDRLDAHGVAAITGPTFSIASERHPESHTPASHNVLMLKRHHRVLSEIPVLTSAVAIPNLYWRDGRERREWSEWLNQNTEIHTVYRDFSRTKGEYNFPPELSGLIEILHDVDRPLHVLADGVGSGNAKTAVIRLAEQNCTCSIITSDPIHKAIWGGEMVLHPDKLQTVENTETDKTPLALHNLKVMERHLIRVASSSPIYDAKTIDNVTTGDKQLRLPNAPQKSPAEECYMEQRSIIDEIDTG